LFERGIADTKFSMAVRMFLAALPHSVPSAAHFAVLVRRVAHPADTDAYASLAVCLCVCVCVSAPRWIV
jgi:hypothetical protein